MWAGRSTRKSLWTYRDYGILGVLLNTKTMTMEVTEKRLLEIRSLLQSWLSYTSASVKQIQSLLGKLNFVAACVKPSRIFISRLLQWLRSINKSSASKHVVPEYVRKDLLWWHKFLPLYNGISMITYEKWSSPDEIFSSDSFGGLWRFLERSILSFCFSRKLFESKPPHYSFGGFVNHTLFKIMGTVF